MADLGRPAPLGECSEETEVPGLPAEPSSAQRHPLYLLLEKYKWREFGPLTFTLILRFFILPSKPLFLSSKKMGFFFFSGPRAIKSKPTHPSD